MFDTSPSRLVRSFMALAVLLLGPWHVVTAQDSTSSSRRVAFVYDDVFQQEKDVIKLLSGSSWRVLAPALVLPAAKIIIVLGDRANTGTAFVSRSRIPVALIDGSPLVRTGALTQVVRALARGAVLETADGVLWEVPSYDQYDTGYWLPPYDVVIYGSDQYMINLREGKRVWVSRSR